MAVLDSYYSEKIKKMSFIMAFIVLVIHSGNNVKGEVYPFAYLFQTSFSLGFCRFAVRMFFLISGYFFFLKVHEWRDCIPNILKRAKSLVVPYLLWNVVFCIVYFILYLFPVSDYVNKSVADDILQLLREGNIISLLGYLFWPQPVNWLLWYVRDLFIFSLFTPFIYWLLNNKWLRYLFFTLVLVLTVFFIVIQLTDCSFS